MAVATTFPACRVTVENSAAPKARTRPTIASRNRIQASRSKRKELSRARTSLPCFGVLAAMEPTLHHAIGALVRGVGVHGEFRKTCFDLSQQLVRPDVLAGKDDEADEEEQD